MRPTEDVYDLADEDRVCIDSVRDADLLRYRCADNGDDPEDEPALED